MPEEWEGTPALDPAIVNARSLVLDARLKGIADRYHDRLPSAFQDHLPDLLSGDASIWRVFRVAKNSVYVAMTGDFKVTNSALYKELARRQVPTWSLPGEFPI